MTDLTGQIGICRNGSSWIAKEIEWATDSKTHHVVVAISPIQCVSAEPGGVVVKAIAEYDNLTWSRFALTGVERAAIIAAGNASLKLPYNYAIYPPLFLSKLTGIPVPEPLAAWLGRRRNVDCSQLADDVYHAAKIQLFAENSDIVTPGDFERLFQRLGFLPPNT